MLCPSRTRLQCDHAHTGLHEENCSVAVTRRYYRSVSGDTGDELHDDVMRLAQARVGSWVAAKWQLETLVGVGGTGAVYRAKHRNGSLVAIKVMHAEHLSNNKHSVRFFREAQYANRIEHEAVLKVFDDGLLEDDCPYLVTELLTGKNLDDERLDAGGVLPLDKVIQIGLYLLDVLEKAHTAGLIHRDLKPVNLFRTTEGAIKMLDFGLGRDLFEKNSGPHKLTSAFVAMGTVGFMAPEQAKGRQELIDATTDLWALGATLLMLATGLDTHEADSPIEGLGLAAVKPVEKTASRVRMMPAFCDFLDKAMSFKQEDRFRTAADMRKALRAVQDNLADGQSTLVDPPKRRAPFAGARTFDNSTLGITTQENAAPTLVAEGPKKWSTRTKRLAPALLGGATFFVGVLVAATVGIQTMRNDSPRAPATMTMQPGATTPGQPPQAPTAPPTPQAINEAPPLEAIPMITHTVPGLAAVPAPKVTPTIRPTGRLTPTIATVPKPTTTAKKHDPLDDQK
jgi:eukaryotic-like serine/threonine-protein kinase